MKSKLTGQRARSKRHRPRAARGLAAMLVEALESRQLLATGSTILAPAWTPTDTNISDIQNGPLANLGGRSISIYESYAAALASAPSGGGAASAAAGLATQFPAIEFRDGLVAMDIKSVGGDFDQFVAQLSGLGMQVTASSASYGVVEGYVPVAALPTIARLPQTLAGSPINAPTYHALQGFQGKAYNEAGSSLMADAVRSAYGLTGAGVTVGVISDSVSQFAGGLQDSYNTGDLDGSHPVNVIQDGSAGSSDEGRAMLEGIHDIAPGASLAFATAGTGPLNFMQNIEALFNAGAKVIVDDISFGVEPDFQDGLVAQGVDYVTSRGATYLSSANNASSDDGYLSAFRSVMTTVNGTTGTFDNFNPGGGAANALLAVTTQTTNVNFVFEYDQPFKTEEPAGATATVTSNVNFYVYNSGGTLVASGTDNNVSTQQPVQTVTVPKAGNYFVAIQLVSGPAPGHVEFNTGDGNIAVSQQYGSAGGTYYPSGFGHEESAATISVGATPWWAPTPFLNQNPLTSEESSSTGPGLIDLSPKGTPITAQITQNPAITGPDGGTTSFFGLSGVDTTQYSPNTPFNDVPTSQQSLKSFFGTSQAAPNVAAVVALMLQDAPSLNRVQILKALENTAEPMNGTPAGGYNLQSGFGEVNAVAAINAIAPPTLAASTTTVTSSVTTPTVGTAFTLSGKVAGSGATPTGSVDFYDISYNTDYGSAALTAGSAGLSLSPSVAGAHLYLVTYSGDTNYAKSTGYLLLNVATSGNGHNAIVRMNNPAFPPTIGSIIPVPVNFPTPPVFSIPLVLSDPSTTDSQQQGTTVVTPAPSAMEASPFIKRKVK